MMTTPAKLWRRIWNGQAAGTITAVDDTGPVLKAQVKIGYLELNDDMPIPQQFGFASVPPLGSDVALHFVGGDRSNGMATASNHQPTRPTGKAAGESMIYNAFGMQIYLSEAGIVINTNGLPVRLNGELQVTGPVTAGFGSADAVTLQTHRHGVGQAAGGTIAPTPGT